MTQSLKAPLYAITFVLSMIFLVVLTLTARADVISRVVDKEIELAKFKANCFEIGQLSYDHDRKQWSCVKREGQETNAALPKHFRY